VGAEETGKEIRLVGRGHADSCVRDVEPHFVVLREQANLDPTPLQRIMIGVAQQVLKGPTQPLPVAVYPQVSPGQPHPQGQVLGLQGRSPVLYYLPYQVGEAEAILLPDYPAWIWEMSINSLMWRNN
jgi:hypothetical protein